jgi:hypothetical protein
MESLFGLLFFLYVLPKRKRKEMQFACTVASTLYLGTVEDQN